MRTAESVVLTDWPPGPRRAEHVDLEVVRVDLDLVGLVDLGEDEHAGRRGVDAALRLGRRHALHAVHAALVLEVRPDALRGVGRVSP